MIGKLDGKRIFITGAAGGIGRKLVAAFLDAGCFVSAADIDEDGLHTLQKLHQDKPLNTINLDIANSAACQSAIDSTKTLDILINNAGASMGLIRENHLDELVGIEELTPNIWDHFITTNLSGAWYLTRAALPVLKAKGWGRIINITTSFFTMLRPMFHPYGPAKAGLEAMTAGHAGEFEKYGITVNVVVPGGPCDTSMVPEVNNIDRNLLIPPESMVAPIMWLSSVDADGVTGKRYIAAHWDASKNTSAARALSEQPIAWQELADSPVWPGGRPDQTKGDEI
jgi:NAD(P)-dependent dehydrogenase (short-subunit alcohol dehydrogenase family)